MFFVRAAFWIFLILLLMPTSDREKSDFYTAASRTISDFGGFCGRNPQVCNSTSSIFENILHKMRNAVDLLEDMVTPAGTRRDAAGGRRERESQHYPQRGPRGDMVAPMSSRGQNTLRPADLQPGWRGPGGGV